jgi:hypothetical protein
MTVDCKGGRKRLKSTIKIFSNIGWLIAVLEAVNEKKLAIKREG